MIQIGINGFGRIGKIIFLQLIEKNMPITAINVPDFDIDNLETYLKYDSTHHYNMNFNIQIINKKIFRIHYRNTSRTIHLLNSRDAKQLNWKNYGVEYVIDATGAYLTQDKANEHNVDYLIMCAPAKDNTPSFMVYGNHEKYNGESIVSNVSCTSNAIIPVLKILNDKYGIVDANFITIHSTTASQQAVDTVKFKNRTSRSLFNNIIPHTTGASSSIYKILPELEGKIYGTSVRVPTSNVSLIDLNVTLNENSDELSDILDYLDSFEQIEIDDNKFKISCDYNTTECACIIDKKACMSMQKNQYKISIWYDNEWSYSYKVLQLLYCMVKYNTENNNLYEKQYFINNLNFQNKRVVLRLDWNVPIDNFIIQDYFRIDSTIKTIQYICNQNPQYILIISHLGRPKGYDTTLSFSNLIKQINDRLFNHLNIPIELLEYGISENTCEYLSKYQNGNIFLLDNIRFYSEETKKGDNFNELRDKYLKLGDIFINDAFACCHRDHLSITAPMKLSWGYGYLIEREVNCLKDIVRNIDNQRILAIMGGSKMDDKLPILETLSKKVDGVYIAGGNINSILKNSKYRDFLKRIRENRAKIYLMNDGLCCEKIDITPVYRHSDDLNENEYFFDIGMQSIVELTNLIEQHDMIFWNGTLGVVENDLYKHGSIALINTLMQKSKSKKIIIGGGDTACFANKFPHNFYYVSTGGGASLEFLSHETLVGLPF
jgi:glyceraldehyde 3-phosphate dehydrogenase